MSQCMKATFKLGGANAVSVFVFWGIAFAMRRVIAVV